MKIKLNKNVIIENLQTEDELIDSSVIESIYVIRKLMGLVESLDNGHIEVIQNLNANGQAFSEEYNIWYNDGEFEIINEE